MATRKINESNNYYMSITDDGTDDGKVVGNMSATLNTANPALSINASLAQGVTLPDAGVIQPQITDFIAQIRAQAVTLGLTSFGASAAAVTTEVSNNG